jgi:D-glycero-alpha-D-manno-heptose-7-phosphate kinase
VKDVIISKTPLRISLGGGGTDLPFYYKQEGGFFISAAVQKHVYVLVANRYEKDIRVSYSKTEICDNIDDIQHPVVKESLRLTGVNNNVEIISFADLPAQSGLGSSGSFTVGLLHALLAFTRKEIVRKDLAELACHIEMDLLKEPSGKQDQYIATFGNITCFSINKDGDVKTEPLKISRHAMEMLENNLVYFYTGVKRSASEVLKDQKDNSKNNTQNIEYLRKIKNIGYEIKKCLENDDVDEFGKLMDIHWEEKKKTSTKVSNSVFDKQYNEAKDIGALGGKIIGAGGGGFFMFYVKDPKSKNNLRKKFMSYGLNEVKMPFEQEGTKIILNLSGRTS